MKSLELCGLVHEYGVEFRENEAQWYQGTDCWDAENQYIKWKLYSEHGIEFESIKALKLFRQEGNVR